MDNDFFKRLVEDMAYGVFVVGPNKTITYWNHAAEKLTGYSCEEVVGKMACYDVLKPLDEEGNLVCGSGCPADSTESDRQIHELEAQVQHKDGRRVAAAFCVSPVAAPRGTPPGMMGILRDNSDMVSARQRIDELETLSLIDPLTKLGNRLYLEMNLLAKLHELRRYGWPVGVLFMDVDNFKSINDEYGHDTGDKMLVTVARALQTQCRPFDVVGRWGGDEFCAIIVHATLEQLESIAERYRAVVEDARLQHGSEIIESTVSVGATLARAEDNVDSLYRRVDQLMYESKSAGKNRVTIETAAPEKPGSAVD